MKPWILVLALITPVFSQTAPPPKSGSGAIAVQVPKSSFVSAEKPIVLTFKYAQVDPKLNAAKVLWQFHDQAFAEKCLARPENQHSDAAKLACDMKITREGFSADYTFTHSGKYDVEMTASTAENLQWTDRMLIEIHDPVTVSRVLPGAQ